MPTVNNPSDYQDDYSTIKPRNTNTQQPDPRSTATASATTARSTQARHDPVDAKHTSERVSSTQQSESRSTAATTHPTPLDTKSTGERVSSTQQSENRSTATSTTARSTPLDTKHTGERVSSSQQTESRSTARPTPDVKHTGERVSSTQQLESENRSTATTARPLVIFDVNPHPGERGSSTQQSENRSTATTARPLAIFDVNPHPGERGSRKDSLDIPSHVTTINNTTTTTTNSNDRHHKARSGLTGSNSSNQSEEDSSGSLEYEHVTYRDQEQSDIPPSNTGRPPKTRVQLNPPMSESPSHAQVNTRSSKDPHHPQGATEGTSARGSGPHQPSQVARRRQDASAQAPPGHHPEDEQPPQASGYGQWISNYIMPGGPDKYQILKEDYNRTRGELRQTRTVLGNHKHELGRVTGELRETNHHYGVLQHQNQRLKDSINGLQNELMNVNQQLEYAKNLSEVRGKELVGSQVFLTKADTLSISEVGEKVTALNEEIFQAAATLGEALIHKRHELSQTESEAAPAVSQEMVGEKMMNTLISQSQKPESEVNPLLVQVVLQILMVKFCISKIQSWYPSDSGIGEFLSAIYSDIRSTGKHRIDSKTKFCLTYNNL
jgi:hypothetical protein